MRNQESWRPTRFVVIGDGIKASWDHRALGRGSRFVGGLQAEAYGKAIREHAHGLLLDVGCGEAPLYQYYRGFITENICVDWPRSFHGSRHIDCACDLSQGLPFSGSTFDTILATDVLEHIENPECLWSEIARVLRPGGKLLLGTPFLYAIHEAPFDYARYTQFQLARSCERVGLAVVSLEPYGDALDTLLDFVGKHLAFSAALSVAHLLVSRTLTRLLSRRRLLRIGVCRFPLGYLLVAEQRGGRREAVLEPAGTEIARS